MTNTYKIKGEGSYGCVIEPSLRCKKTRKKINYTNKVSKIMRKKHARKELDEFKIIDKFDTRNRYHLGDPTLCEPDLEPEDVLTVVKKCSRLKYNDKKYDDKKYDEDAYEMLVLEDGGDDLYKLCNNNKLDLFSQTDTVRFLQAIPNLLHGLNFFKKHKLVHADLKPQNIVYNKETGELKFIDFGFMTTMDNMKNASKQSINRSGSFWWSYPLDNGFMNKSAYEKIKHVDLKLVEAELTNAILDSSPDLDVSYEYLPNNKKYSYSQLQVYFNKYIEPNGANEKMIKNSIKRFFKGLEILMQDGYDAYLDNTINTFDSYCVGFSLQYVFNKFEKKRLIKHTMWKQLTNIFSQLYDPDPTRRATVLSVLNEYNDWMEKHNIPLIHNMSISDKSVHIDKSSEEEVPTMVFEEPVKEKSIKDKSIKEMSVKDKSIKEMTEVKKCPEDKELNPITKRCNKKCKSGYHRDSLFKCVTNRRPT